MSKTILVDLSHPFGRGNPLWPSNGDFHIDRVQHMPMHYRLLQTFNDFHMHNSTHADSPSHVIPESPYTHELPLENYYGPAVCLDIPKKHWELITVEDIEKAAAKVEGGIQEQARQSLNNIKAILNAAGTNMGAVVKTTVFLQDMNDFAAMNEVYAQFFQEPYPARSAVQVGRLPKDALVEIEAIAQL